MRKQCQKFKRKRREKKRKQQKYFGGNSPNFLRGKKNFVQEKYFNWLGGIIVLFSRKKCKIFFKNGQNRSPPLTPQKRKKVSLFKKKFMENLYKEFGEEIIFQEFFFHILGAGIIIFFLREK